MRIQGVKRVKNKKLDERDYLMAMLISKHFCELGYHFVTREEVSQKEIIETDDNFNMAMEFIQNDKYRDILYTELENGIEKIMLLEDERIEKQIIKDIQDKKVIRIK